MVGGPVVWNGFTRGALDAAYNNAAAVPGSAERIARWTARSDALRARQPSELDIAYGAGPRNRFDVFRCGRADAPLVVFIHGGWWQRNSKEVFSCMAEGPMAAGFDVALPGYTLAPEATLGQIAAEIRAALDAVAAHQAARGGCGSFILAGWSAGGHLSALTLDHRAVTAGLAISGVFDLEPLRHCYVNDALGLDEATAASLSPARRPVCAKPLALAFGLGELPELQRQSADFGALRAAGGQPAFGLPLAGHDHFSILEELASPGGVLAGLLVGLARQ